MSRVEQIGAATLYHGDSRDVLRGVADNSVDSVVTDPPYALVSIVKRFGGEKSHLEVSDTKDLSKINAAQYKRLSGGFMGQKWDTGETAFAVEFWREVMRVLKPGGHVVAASGTRTYHRLAVAIEDAGFEIRDMVSWLYGSGFPKSHNQGNGWGTALKPACEPWVLARKPLVGTVAANLLAHGTGALNIDGCRVGETGARNNGRTVDSDIYGKLGAFQRVEYNKGRWPANVIHDGSEEVVGAFPVTTATGVRSATSKARWSNAESPLPGAGGTNAKGTEYAGDSGSAARFFYSAKADAMDRIGSKHPTVKPVDLMQYLCRLVTPPGGVILDPFAGSGTTGEAAWREGFRAILIEREAEYFEDIVRRMRLCGAGPETRKHAVAKARGKVEAPGGLFAAEAVA